MKDYGFLAIWCEISAEDLDDYRAWLTQEHIADRTFSPGFLGVRVFEELDNPLAHFILYATDGPEVLNGAEYKAILDNPSPWTQRIMPKFGPFDRALGHQILKIGNGFGSHVAIWKVRLTSPALDTAHLNEELSIYLGKDGIVSLRVCQLNHDTTDRHSVEKTMRGGNEGDFDLLLVAETTDASSVLAAKTHLSEALPNLFQHFSEADGKCFRMFYGEAAHEGPSLSL
ncbi:hypothetical protein [Actibacterium pelagium]|uniref:DUF4286 family protein n=1 Tax=Actibacterium pelagium TaxID=2029103 RepID=A0A917ADH9_9RHOB|nr:hypothetical protein [Actibacterium pelagium]GGE43709.1 hypothetical protein GCM10011517_09230 [Actibacterium pelagium]